MKMEVIVSARRAGVLAAISVKPGDVVHRGAILARMVADALAAS
jgi:biotin carboxyl carrier protein